VCERSEHSEFLVGHKGDPCSFQVILKINRSPTRPQTAPARPQTAPTRPQTAPARPRKPQPDHKQPQPDQKSPNQTKKAPTRPKKPQPDQKSRTKINVQNELAIFGPQKPVSKAFLRGLFLEIHPTLVTTTFRKVEIPKLSCMEPFLDIFSDK